MHNKLLFTNLILLLLINYSLLFINASNNDYNNDNNDTTKTTTTTTKKNKKTTTTNNLPEENYFIREILNKFGDGKSLTNENFKSLLKQLNLGGSNIHGRDKLEQVNNKRKRRTLFETKCFNAGHFLDIFSIPDTGTINDAKFEKICPALIQQIESDACALTKKNGEKIKEIEDSSNWKPWIGAMLSIFIISVGSLVGVFATPFAKRTWFPYLMMFLIALAVSVLLNDALLHLAPEALGLHHQPSKNLKDITGNPMLKEDSYLWKCILLLTGVYLFYLFELFMHAFGRGHSHNHSDMENLEMSGILNSENKQENACESIYAPKTKLPMKKFKSVVWMILIGDAIHNFMDGVAIGTAFTEVWPGGLHGGVSTSFAILCHELPHELGDFAVLLNSGLSIKQALLMNFVSALTCFIGGIVGVLLGTTWKATPWIFAITAGLFIYISLVDMLPEILHNKLLKSDPWKCILIQLSGIIVGLVIMFVIAAWEDDITNIAS